MMPIRVRVSNNQIITGEEPQSIDFETEAHYVLKNGWHYITYDETELTGMEKVKTIVQFSEKELFVKRYGAVASKLRFKQGDRAVSDYVTPYGTFRMELKTERLQIDISPNMEGTIYVCYTLVIQSSVESKNELKIELLSTV